MENVQLYGHTDQVCQNLVLTHVPPKMQECFDLLTKAGAEYYCLFGGAVRDTDISGRSESKADIKDYDLRVWFDCEKKASQFINQLKTVSQVPITIEHCVNSDNLRYCLLWKDIDLDISIRIVAPEKLSISAVAQDRAMKADIGLSAVAIDATGQGWCRPEYIDDRNGKTLTVYPNNNEEQKKSYMERMLKKYPDYKFIVS